MAANETAQLAAILARGEDSRHQFKRDFTHVESLASELAAFANMNGGTLLIGVDDSGVVTGLTAGEEMQRMFQQSGLLHADEQNVASAGIEDIDPSEFASYFERRYKRPVAATGLPLPQLLQNLNLARGGRPNLACVMLFGVEPNVHLPAFFVKAVAFPGTVLHDHRYLDNENIAGTLAQQHRHCMAFLGRNLHHVQGDRGFNSPGELEIPHHVLEEIIVNALVHRDYLISAPIRLLVFVDRVEIISPGHLPNHLDTSQIRFGVSNLRNPALASHAFHMLPYQGLGSGIPRAIEDWPHIEFVDDRAGNQFKVILRRAERPDGTASGAANFSPATLLKYIENNPGQRTQALAEALKTPRRTLQRSLKKLLEANLIEFVGSPRTGGYHSTRPASRNHSPL